MNQRPDARPEPTPDALPLDLLPPLDRDSQITRPNPPGGEHRPVLQPDEAVAGATGSGARLDLLPTRLLIGKDGETRSIWPVHLAGWRALGWQVLAPVLQAAGEAAAPGEAGAPEAELEPDQDSESDPDLEGQQPELPETGDAGPVPPDPEQPDGEEEASPQPAAPPAPEATPAPEVPDFAAMTKAEIVAFCSASYGVSLDGTMTKAELVEEATALHASTDEDGVVPQDLPRDLV